MLKAQGPSRTCNERKEEEGDEACGRNPGADLKSISHRCHPILVAFVREVTKETIDLPLGCLQGGARPAGASALLANSRRRSAPAIRAPADAPVGSTSRGRQVRGGADPARGEPRGSVAKMRARNSPRHMMAEASKRALRRWGARLTLAVWRATAARARVLGEVCSSELKIRARRGEVTPASATAQGVAGRRGAVSVSEDPCQYPEGFPANEKKLCFFDSPRDGRARISHRRGELS